jgi:hypothetical protein
MTYSPDKTGATDVEILISQFNHCATVPDTLFQIWLELAKHHALELTASDEDGNRGKLNRLMSATFKGFASHPLAKTEKYRHYVPFMLRFFFAAGDFSQNSLAVATSLYSQLSDENFTDNLDCHYFWQWFHGSTRGLQQVRAKSQKAYNNSQLGLSQSELYKALEAMLDGNDEKLKGLIAKPHRAEPLSWRQLPLLEWQYQSLEPLLP